VKSGLASNHAVIADHDHEDATTHEDRKTSTSSDAHFYDQITTCGGASGLELEHPLSSVGQKQERASLFG
jgi:hypothetical protein